MKKNLLLLPLLVFFFISCSDMQFLGNILSSVGSCLTENDAANGIVKPLFRELRKEFRQYRNWTAI